MAIGIIGMRKFKVKRPAPVNQLRICIPPPQLRFRNFPYRIAMARNRCLPAREFAGYNFPSCLKAEPHLSMAMRSLI
jgi:hypothetical protein